MLFYLVSVLYAKLYLSMETRYGHITAIMVKTYQDLIKLIGMKLYLIFMQTQMGVFMAVHMQNIREGGTIKMVQQMASLSNNSPK
ncbi:hypothetical protein HMPREF1022_01985 [Desulfovibrio sp. 6_1_46AFAA]|nr:hypothetical protein HMPREF1022_01985 [Desulfovibrio sp. 6_1_46AFAA]